MFDGKLARAWWGLGRVADCNSLHRTAEQYFRKAHDLDPGDPDILFSYAHLLQLPERLDALRRYLTLAAHYAEAERLEDVRRQIGVEEQVGGRELGLLASPYQRVEIPLVVLPHDEGNIRGFGVPVSINGSRPLRLLLDTGASGIILRAKAARKAGVERLAETVVRGIGDGGDRETYGAIAAEVRIGNLVFDDYLLDVADRSALHGEDGIIGTDVFADFLVTLDFRRRKLVLNPLPGGRPKRGQTCDRQVLSDFIPVFRVSHLFLVATKISDTMPVLFILDTGASSTMISTKAASAATRVRADSNTRLRGVSGSVRRVSRAEDVMLEFAGFRQRNRNAIALDLNHLSKETGIEVSGLLGLPLLQAFTITLDYRDGLVKFE